MENHDTTKENDIIANKNNEYKHDVDLAGEFGNLVGRAELLESFYCYQEDDSSKDFGLGYSMKSLPALPSELGFYRDQAFQVNMNA